MWLSLTVGLLSLDLFLVIFDTYFLRSRHYFAGKFYPDRVRPRAVWLYNNVLRRRGPMMKFLFFNVWQNSKNTFQSTFYDVVVARSRRPRTISFTVTDLTNNSHIAKTCRRLADGDIHCAGSATYQICFRLPIPNPNPNPKP